jgi:hypothetical protein
MGEFEVKLGMVSVPYSPPSHVEKNALQEHSDRFRIGLAPVDSVTKPLRAEKYSD